MISPENCPVDIEDICDLAQLAEICEGFAELRDIGIKVISLDQRELADCARANGLLQWLIGRPQTRLQLLDFMHHLRCEPVNLGERKAFVEPLTGFRYLLLPICCAQAVVAKLVCGPYVESHLPVTPKITFDQPYEAQRFRVLRGAVPRRTESALADEMELLQRTLAGLWQSGFRSLQQIRALREENAALQDELNALHAENEGLQEMTGLKSSFLATLSHELRTPLTSILNFSEFLLGEQNELDGEQRYFAQSIFDRGTSLMHILANVFEISRLESGPQPLANTLIRPGSLARSIAASMKVSMEVAQLHFTVEIEPNLPNMRGDRHQVTQAVSQVLLNAIKFTPAEGRVKFTVRAIECPESRDGRGICFEVTDTGIGIAKDRQKQIFSPLYQVDHRENRDFEGAGLGLTLAKRFVEAHEGHLDVDSEIGRGSTFSLNFPCKHRRETLGLDSFEDL